MLALKPAWPVDSPVSNNGRGLKRPFDLYKTCPEHDSPVSNNGRGLKLNIRKAVLSRRGVIRPLAITGVD